MQVQLLILQLVASAATALEYDLYKAAIGIFCRKYKTKLQHNLLG